MQLVYIFLYDPLKVIVNASSLIKQSYPGGGEKTKDKSNLVWSRLEGIGIYNSIAWFQLGQYNKMWR